MVETLTLVMDMDMVMDIGIIVKYIPFILAVTEKVVINIIRILILVQAVIITEVPFLLLMTVQVGVHLLESKRMLWYVLNEKEKHRKERE